MIVGSSSLWVALRVEYCRYALGTPVGITQNTSPERTRPCGEGRAGGVCPTSDNRGNVSRWRTLADLGEELKYGCSLTCLWYPCNCTTGLTHVESLLHLRLCSLL